MTEAQRGAGRRCGFALATVALLLVLSCASAQARDAYVVNRGSNSVSVFDTQTNLVIGAPITVGEVPEGIAITPDGKTAYVGNSISKSVSVINTQTNRVVGAPIIVGAGPAEIAVTPDGKRVYVVNEGANDVSVIDSETNQVVGAPIPVGTEPVGIAITPDGKTAYVTNSGSKSVSVLDLQTNQAVSSITVGKMPFNIAITPDGRTAYVVNLGSKTVSVISTLTNQVVPSSIKLGEEPGSIAITPDGRTAYVVNNESGDLSVIDTQTNQLVGAPIKIHVGAIGIAITPDGRVAYVTETGPTGVNRIDTQTGLTGALIGVGLDPFGIAIVPDQPPTASFASPRARPGVPLALDASGSSDADGTIATYSWSFGDGEMATGGPRLKHTYSKPGTYQATLTLIDNEGCSTSLVFTGQTAYCNGAAAAGQTRTLRVAYPGVRVRCPKSARPGGCKYKLRVVSKKRKGKAESAVGKGRAKAGKSVVVTLLPKSKFRSKLAAAKKLLIEETLLVGGSRQTTYRRLEVVQ